MYIHSVKMNNFKSIGNTELSMLILERTVTAIIGKNESGKSNVLEGLSHIGFDDKRPETYSSECVNRYTIN